MIFPSALTTRVIIAKMGASPEYFQAGDSLLKPGMVCMEDDADEVKACITTGKPFGIVGCDADHDLNTVYAAGERVPVWKLGCGAIIMVRCGDITPAQTITKGAQMDTADATTWVGCGKVRDALVAVTTTVGGNGALRNISEFFVIGEAQATGSITTEVTRYVPILLR